MGSKEQDFEERTSNNNGNDIILDDRPNYDNTNKSTDFHELDENHSDGEILCRRKRSIVNLNKESQPVKEILTFKHRKV